MANPKPKPKLAPTPVKKAVSPGARAAASQQKAATAGYKTTVASQAKANAPYRALKGDTRSEGANIRRNAATPAAKAKPGTGYQPPRTMTRPAGPKTTILGPRGQSNISAAMKGGAERDYGVLRGRKGK